MALSYPVKPKTFTSHLISSSKIKRSWISAVSPGRIIVIKETLEKDLPNQYISDLDWSIYSNDIAFIDPVTKLEVL